VPLALGLMSVSNPKLQILDTLSKFSHDSDPEVTQNSIFAMGLVGAGTSCIVVITNIRGVPVLKIYTVNSLIRNSSGQGKCVMSRLSYKC